jgi:hypothetical protein
MLHRPSRSWTASRCRCVASVGPIAVGGWPGWPPLVVTRALSKTFYGVRAHLRVCWPGVIGDGHLAPANLHDLAMADDLVAGAHGWVLGDRSYWSPARAGLLADQGVWLLAPSRSVKGPGRACLAG